MDYTDEYVPNHALICAINLEETELIQQLLLDCPLVDIFYRYSGLFSYTPIIIALSELEVHFLFSPMTKTQAITHFRC